MSAPTPLYRPCGLDLQHEAHPNADGSHCTGQADATAAAGGPPETLAALLGVVPLPRPWCPPSLTTDLADQLAEQLQAFATHLNTTHAVKVEHLVLGCWPRHPGLVWELAALYSAWVGAHQGLAATAELAVTFYERHLPAFYQRLEWQYGHAPDACTPRAHRDDWNPAATKLAEVAANAEDPQEAVAALRVCAAYVPPDQPSAGTTET